MTKPLMSLLPLRFSRGALRRAASRRPRPAPGRIAALLGAVMALGVAVPAMAQERVTLGWGRLLTNDIIGDGRDRWRTGSYVLGLLRGPAGLTGLPQAPGEVLEFRARLETIAPADLVTPDPADRRYVGAISLGVHSHFERQGIETSLGLDAVIIGPQTGIASLHGDLHDVLGLPRPTVFGAQIGNAVLPSVTVEFGRSLDLGGARLRPFVEAQAGAETMLRLGGDLTLGRFGEGAILLRDVSTGQRYRGTAGGGEGLSLTLGGDVARVFDSAFFEPLDAATPSDSRARLRAGLHWQGAAGEMFYGLTWLGEEFEQQTSGQVLGSVNLRLQF